MNADIRFSTYGQTCIKACFNIYFFNLWRRLFLFNLIVKTIQNTLHTHIIPNIIKISLKRVEMNFGPESKNSIIAKTARYDRIINELCHFCKVPLIKTGLMSHKYHLLNQLQVFMRYKKLPKWALISLVNFGTKKNSGLIKLEAQWAEPVSAHLSFRFEETLYRTFHRCFLPSFVSFGHAVSKKIF